MAARYRKCRICRVRLEVGQGIVNGLDFVCGIEHLAELGLQRAQKQKDEQRKAKKRELKQRREKLKSRTDWLREAQQVFNAFIRERDKALPCVSCGKPPSGNRNGGSTRDAGHYRTVGACSALRFDEHNVHAQCVECNQHKSGNLIEYRIGLRQRIGEAGVEALETTNPLRRWTIEEAKTIKAEYKAKLNALREGEG